MRDWFSLMKDDRRVQRFWDKVDRSAGPGECWPWLRSQVPAGYGQFMVTPGQPMRAHRIAWALAHRQSPGRGVVRHRCDNPLCCNPAHLLLGTQRDNCRDAVKRGRARGGSTPRPGESHPNHKITEKEVAELRGLDGLTCTAMAERYGISPAQVSRIRAGKRWSHVSD